MFLISLFTSVEVSRHCVGVEEVFSLSWPRLCLGLLGPLHGAIVVPSVTRYRRRRRGHRCVGGVRRDSSDAW